MSELDTILAKLEELQAQAASGPDAETLREHGVEARPFMWRIYDKERRLNIGEITKTGFDSGYRVFCYQTGDNISEHDTESLSQAITLLKWRDACNCEGLWARGQPIWCRCGAREKFYPTEFRPTNLAWYDSEGFDGDLSDFPNAGGAK